MNVPCPHFIGPHGKETDVAQPFVGRGGQKISGGLLDTHVFHEHFRFHLVIKTRQFHFEASRELNCFMNLAEFIKNGLVRAKGRFVGVDDRNCWFFCQELETPNRGFFFFIKGQVAHRKWLVKLFGDFREHFFFKQQCVWFLPALKAGPDFFKTFFRNDKVAKEQFLINRPDVAQRIARPAQVGWKRPRDERKRIDASNEFHERGRKRFFLYGAFGNAHEIHELDGRESGFLGFIHFRQPRHARVADFYYGDVGFRLGNGILRNLRPWLGQCVEKGGFARLGQAEKSDFQSASIFR